MRGALASLLVVLSAAAATPAQTGTFESDRRAAQAYLGRHEVAAALPWLEKAYRAAPSQYDNAYDLALAYLETGQPARSRQVIAELLRSRNTAELHNLLGDVAEAQSLPDEAAREYQAAARMDPSAKNLFDLGSHLLRHRAFEPAVKVFAYGVGRDPRSAPLRVGLGIAYYSLGRYDDAVETLCQAVDLDPQDPRALDFLGGMVDVSPQLARQVSTRLARFARLYPANPSALYYYALSLRKRASGGASPADDREARALLERAVQLNPSFAAAHFELGLLHEDHGEQASAIREYQAATRLNPRLSKAHYRLGKLYQKSGQPALARQEFQAFESTRNPQSPSGNAAAIH